MRASDRWLRLLLRLYPVDFRDEMGEALLETYRDRCRAAVHDGGIAALAGVWLRSLVDSMRNGLGERVRPAVGWRRSGNWGRDTERAVRRLMRAPLFTLSMLATLTVGLGAFAMVFTVVQKVLLAPLPYERPDDLYFVWRDYGKVFDLKRGSLAGTDVAALEAAGGVIEGASALDRGAAHARRGGDPGRATPARRRCTCSPPRPTSSACSAPGRRSGGPSRPGEVGPGRPALIVLGHELWQRRFGGDRAVLGTDVVLDGQPFQVIGVMGPDFRLGRARRHRTRTSRTRRTSPRRARATAATLALIRARAGTSPALVASAIDAVGRMVDERDHEGKGVTPLPGGAQGRSAGDRCGRPCWCSAPRACCSCSCSG